MNLKLGDKVKVAIKYQRNYKKPFVKERCTKEELNYIKRKCDRYIEERVDYEGVIVGTRSIHVSGFTSYNGEVGYYFCPVKTVSVYLVAINMTETIYVPKRSSALMRADANG